VKNALAASVLVAASTSLMVRPAFAQTVAEGFSLNQFSPSEAGSDWFSADSLDLRGNGRLAVGLVLDYAYRPLVIRDGAGNVVVAPVTHQMFADLGAAVNVVSRLRLAVSIPLALVDTGTAGIVNGESYQTDHGVALGDLRAGADLSVLGNYREPFQLAIGLQATAPTGAKTAYTGDGKFRILPHVSAAGDIGLLAYALQVAFDGRLRNDSFGGQPLGNGIRLDAATGVRVDGGALLLGPELLAETSIKSGKAFQGPNTQLELLLGGHYEVDPSWRVGLGAGRGFTSAVGSPVLRVLASLTYFTPVAVAPPPLPEPLPPPPPPPLPPPPPPDRDNDGVPDADDACPDEAGLAALKGCPDTDGDGIADKDDACPKLAGPRNDDLSKNGCPPPPDADHDGIPDSADACPDKAGDPDPNPAKNGCPKIQVVKGEIRILERIEFDNKKATLRPETEPLLQAIRHALADHTEIKRVRLEGYTDSRGRAAFNLKLSQARVDAVRQWLIDHGIDAFRMVAAGFGKTNPVADNATEQGRQRNRRVQIIILEQSDAPAAR
jgi:OOP family OmpA-OmpF porin